MTGRSYGIPGHAWVYICNNGICFDRIYTTCALEFIRSRLCQETWYVGRKPFLLQCPMYVLDASGVNVVVQLLLYGFIRKIR